MATRLRPTWAAAVACLVLAAPFAAVADPASGISPGVRDPLASGVDSGEGGDCARLQAALAQASAQDQAAGAAMGLAVETLAAAQAGQPGSPAVTLAREGLLSQQQRRTDAAQALQQAQQRLEAAHCL